MEFLRQVSAAKEDLWSLKPVPPSGLGWRTCREPIHDLAFLVNSCYNGIVYYANGADKMKPAGSRIRGGQGYFIGLGTDPLTALLVGLAVFLTAAMAALGVDLVLRPVNTNPVQQASTPREPSGLILTALAEPPPTSSSLPTASPAPTATPCPPAVRIRIPAIGVDRSIVEVPLAYDSRSKTWKRDYKQLFRAGKPDLVGHNTDSASPGQPGNTILVGHNYGYGVNGVFLRLGRLRPGHQVEVVNATGQTFAYQVTEVTSVPWTTKDQQQILEHQEYLSVQGPERLTLVTCGGSHWAPFPDRVYVVAQPSH